MNSVKKGDDFELRTYHILRKLLDNNGLEIQLKGQNEFWIVPSSAHIKQKDKKKFPWGDSVINDLTIEGVEKQNDFLILIECKDYGHPVDRGDIAEFNTRIQDLKALVSAKSFCNVKNLGLISSLGIQPFSLPLFC